MNHIINGIGGSLLAYIAVDTTGIAHNIGGLDGLIKAIVSLIVGTIGAFITNWINKKLSKSTTNPTK
jgi:uncharacterized membrane protein YeaQ/YmgE (transglycosylase-associated protein family)